MKGKSILLVLASGFLLLGCMSDKKMEEKVSEILKEKPEVLTEAIRENPLEFVEALQTAAKDARKEMAQEKQQKAQQEIDKYIDDPLKPEIRDDEAIRGPKDAPITLVEYSDFECPFCRKGYNTVQSLMEKYDGKIRFIYKHLPLDFHDKAMISAKYFEAIRLQSEKKAFEFHDKIFENQKQLQNGEKFLKKMAKEAGADMGQLKEDLNSKEVEQRIEADQKEAAKYGMRGTPGFVINGIPIRGAYPADKFVSIINKLKEKGKLTL